MAKKKVPKAHPAVGASRAAAGKSARRPGKPSRTEGLGVVDRSADWHSKARCKEQSGSITSLFFSEEYFEIHRAKLICQKCPVRAECLAAAKDRAERFGVWGGELFRRGVPVTPRKVGRPPVNEVPPMFNDEVPFPPNLLSRRSSEGQRGA